MADAAIVEPVPERTASPWPLVLLLLGGVGIGFAPIFVRIADIGPLPSAFWRLALSVPAFALGALLARRQTARIVLGRRDYGMLVTCGVFFAADMGLWHLSIMNTSVANATLLANLNPVFVALVGFLFLGQRFRRLFVFALVLALAGSFLLVHASLDFGGGRVVGDALGVGTAMMYAGYFLTASGLRRRHSTMIVMLWTSVVTALVLLPPALLAPGAFWPSSTEGWLILVTLALVSQVGGQGLIVYALAHLPPAFSAVSLLIQPVVAAAAAWIFFGEALGSTQFFGAALILVGIVLARRAMH